MTKEIPIQLYFKSLFQTYRPRITLNIIEIKAITSSI